MALVDYRTDGPVAVITLNNAPANCYSLELNKELDEAVLRARFDDSVHVIVLTGAGDRFFCAGADIAMLESVTPRYKYYFCLHANETMLRMEQTPKLVIAALNGHTVGGGYEIALAADVRIGWRRTGEGAKQILVGMPEVALGVLPGTGGTQRLTRLIGKSRAIDVLVTGDNLKLDAAIDAGLVNRAIDADTVEDFQAQIIEHAKSFAPPHKASMAVGLIKRACQTGAEVGLAQGLALERELQQRLFESEDAREGLEAFNEKRAPAFKGR